MITPGPLGEMAAGQGAEARVAVRPGGMTPPRSVPMIG